MIISVPGLLPNTLLSSIFSPTNYNKPILFLTTPFSIPHPTLEYGSVERTQWINYRLNYFLKSLHPSVLQQYNQNEITIHWLYSLPLTIVDCFLCPYLQIGHNIHSYWVELPFSINANNNYFRSTLIHNYLNSFIASFKLSANHPIIIARVDSDDLLSPYYTDSLVLISQASSIIDSKHSIYMSSPCGLNLHLPSLKVSPYLWPESAFVVQFTTPSKLGNTNLWKFSHDKLSYSPQTTQSYQLNLYGALLASRKLSQSIF